MKMFTITNECFPKKIIHIHMYVYIYRAQSVRRTSLRDKTLTTKKDAVEEARLRLQAQEVYVTATPDSTTNDPNGLADHQLESSAEWLAKNSASSANHHHHHHHITNNNNNNNTLKTNNNHRNSYDPSLNDLVDSNCISSKQQQQHSYQPRRPPEGRENDELQMHAFKTNGEHSTGGLCLTNGALNDVGSNGDGTSTSSASATTAAAVIAAATTATTTGRGPEAVQIQSSKEATNGKINVQVTVLVGKCN